MWPRGGGRCEQLPCRAARRRRAGRQDRGLEIALNGALRIALLQIGQVDAPIDAEHLGRQARVRVDEMRGVLQEQDPRNARAARGLEQRREVRANQLLPARARQEPGPRVEDLYGVRARSGLAAQVIDHEIREPCEQTVEQQRLGRCERTERGEVLGALTLDEVRRERPRRAAETRAAPSRRAAPRA